MEASDIQRVEEDDPTRCQSRGLGGGQCINKSVPGGTVCMVHGGNKQLQSQAIQAVRNYRLGKFQAELERHADSPILKNLREEIGILRMTLEHRFARCEDATDLILQSGPISELVMKIERVVSSCHKLEGSMGQLLDKQAILQFASEMISIIEKTIGELIPEEQGELKKRIVNTLASKIMLLVGGSENAGI